MSFHDKGSIGNNVANSRCKLALERLTLSSPNVWIFDGQGKDWSHKGSWKGNVIGRSEGARDPVAMLGLNRKKVVRKNCEKMLRYLRKATGLLKKRRGDLRSWLEGHVLLCCDL